KSSNGAKVLEPGAKETMLVAIPTDPALPMKFDWSADWVLGRGSSRGEHDGLYRPPFPADMTFDTLNTADGGHAAPRQQYAIDIMMPQGTPVIAARSGYVTDVKGEIEGDKINTAAHPYYETDAERAKMGNYVRIYHDDGTFAEYLHLQDKSVRVSP